MCRAEALRQRQRSVASLSACVGEMSACLGCERGGGGGFPEITAGPDSRGWFGPPSPPHASTTGVGTDPRGRPCPRVSIGMFSVAGHPCPRAAPPWSQCVWGAFGTGAGMRLRLVGRDFQRAARIPHPLYPVPIPIPVLLPSLCLCLPCLAYCVPKCVGLGVLTHGHPLAGSWAHCVCVSPWAACVLCVCVSVSVCAPSPYAGLPSVVYPHPSHTTATPVITRGKWRQGVGPPCGDREGGGVGGCSFSPRRLCLGPRPVAHTECRPTCVVSVCMLEFACVCLNVGWGLREVTLWPARPLWAGRAGLLLHFRSQ